MKRVVAGASGIAVTMMLALQSVSAADIQVLSSAAIKPAIDVLGPQFEGKSKNKLVIRYVLTPAVPTMIEGGEVVDVAIANPAHIDALIKSGKVAAASRAQVVRFGLGVGVRAGAAKPNVGSTDALREALLKANSLAFVGAGSSGPFVTRMLDKLGILDAMKPKLRPGDIAANLGAVAKGAVELVIMPVPLILAAKGVDLAGLMPAEFQDYLVMAAGLATAAPQAAPGQAFIQHLMSNEADGVFKSKGYERVPK